MNVEKTQLVCMSKDMLETPHAAGSVLVAAECCGVEVWIGPALQPMVGKEEYEVCCIRCLFRADRFWKDIKSKKIPAEMRAMLNDLLGVAEVDQLIAKHGFEEA